MSNYSTRGKEVKESNIVSKWMPVETVQIAKIVNTEFLEAKTGSKGIKFTFMTPPVKDVIEHEFGTGQIAEERLWLSEKARPYTQNKVILLADKLGVRDALDAAMDTVTNDEEYVTAIGKTLRNVPGAFIIGGEEVAIEDKETGEMSIWIKPTLYPYGAIGTTEEFGALEERCNKLKNSDKLIKRLEVSPKDDIVSQDSSYSEDDSEELF